jgi:hypothetical protein
MRSAEVVDSESIRNVVEMKRVIIDVSKFSRYESDLSFFYQFQSVLLLVGYGSSDS